VRPSIGDPFARSRDGWLLAGLIILISLALITAVGITRFLTEHLRVVSLRQNQTRAIYLAQAGVMQAIFDFRYDGPGGVTVDGNNIRLGTYDVVPGDQGAAGLADDDVFLLTGRAADFLLAAMIPAGWQSASICGGASNRQRLQGWTLRNVLLTASTTPVPPDPLPPGLPVVIDFVEISWQPNNGELVYRLDLMGTGADYNSCTGTPSGGSIDVNQTIAPTTEGSNRIWFSRRTTESAPPSLLMTNKDWIQIRFLMTDLSVRTVRFLPASPTESSANFTVKSTGEVRAAPLPFVVSRRLQAEYRLNDDDLTVTNFSEVGSILSDAGLQRAAPAPVGDQRPGYHEIPVQQP